MQFAVVPLDIDDKSTAHYSGRAGNNSMYPAWFWSSISATPEVPLKLESIWNSLQSTPGSTRQLRLSGMAVCPGLPPISCSFVVDLIAASSSIGGTFALVI